MSKLTTYKLNYEFQKPDIRDFKLAKVSLNKTLPKIIDISPQMPPVLDQGSLGSCVSCAVSNCLRFCLRKENLKEIQPSRLFVYYNGRQISYLEENPKATPEELEMVAEQDEGLSLRVGAKSISKFRACSESMWPYVIRKFSIKPDPKAYKEAETFSKLTYWSVNQTENDIKNCLYQGFPIALGILVYSSFLTRNASRTGIIPMPSAKDTVEGGHAIILVGYNDIQRRFKCMNSWGKSWGDKGYFYIPYDYILSSNLAADFWTFRFFST